MATAAEELTALKLRAAKKQGTDRVTLINHTADSKVTCTVTEAITVLAALVDKGYSHHSIHIVDHKAEKERKLTNPNGTTRRVFNCRTPEQWKQFNMVLEPYYDEAVDPHIAIDLVIKALAAFSRETIKEWVRQEIAAVEPEPGLPEFLQG